MSNGTIINDKHKDTLYRVYYSQKYQRFNHCRIEANEEYDTHWFLVATHMSSRFFNLFECFLYSDGDKPRTVNDVRQKLYEFERFNELLKEYKLEVHVG